MHAFQPCWLNELIAACYLMEIMKQTYRRFWAMLGHNLAVISVFQNVHSGIEGTLSGMMKIPFVFLNLCRGPA